MKHHSLSLVATTVFAALAVTGIGAAFQARQPHQSVHQPGRATVASVTSVGTKPVEAITTPQGKASKALHGQVVVKITDQNVVRQYGSQLHPMLAPNTYRLTVSDDASSAVRRLAATPGIAAVSPDYVVTETSVQKTTVPNDSLYNSYQWSLGKIAAPAAWDRTTGTSSTVIASIDTGVNFNHEDLVGRGWTNPGDTAGNALDDDGNGYVDDTRGMDFVNGTQDGAGVWHNSPQGPVDDEGHGSLTTSVMAANSNNSQGIAGINWQAKVMPVKALDTHGFGSLSTIADAIRYATDNHAKVINLSLGAFGVTSDFATDEAISYATSHGVVLVAASGNDGSSGTVSYPAINPNVIAVGATDSGDTVASYSDGGPNLALVAPGTGIATVNAVMDQPRGLTLALGTGTLAAGSYRYEVTAYNANGETIPSSPPSNNANQDLITTSGTNGVVLRWSSVYGATGYRVYRTAAGGNEGTQKRLSDVGNTTSYTDSGSVALGTVNPPTVNQGVLNSGYATASGTSLAAPHVAAAASLLVGLSPNLSPAQVKSILQNSSDKVAGMNGQTRTDAYGTGRLNLLKALQALPPWGAQYAGQSAFPALTSGNAATAYVDFQNSGSQTWHSDGASPVRLGTSHPKDRSSALANFGWINPTRPASFAGKMVNGNLVATTSIEPGETGRFPVTVTAPNVSQTTTYREYFQPVAEGAQWMEDIGQYWDVVVAPPPVPQVTFNSPSDGSTVADHTATIGLTVSANGNALLGDRDVKVTPVVRNTVSPNAPGASREVLTGQSQTVHFASATDSQTLQFNTLPLLFAGDNYVAFQIATTDGKYVMLAGGDDAPTMLHLTYASDHLILPVYRFWSPVFANAHFFTLNSAEKERLIANDNAATGGHWVYEGISFQSTPTDNGSCGSQSPVYRFWSTAFQSHFYTVDTSEKDRLISSDPNWAYEGPAMCADATPTAGSTSLYRFWSQTYRKHFFTAATAEKDRLINNDPNWHYEGIAFYVQ